MKRHKQMPVSPVFKKQREEDGHWFEVALCLIVSSSTLASTLRINIIQEKKTQKGIMYIFTHPAFFPITFIEKY